METPKPHITVNVSSTQRADDTRNWTFTAIPQLGNQRPIGFASLTSGPGFSLVHSVVVHPSVRRRTVGDQIMKRIVESALKMWPKQKIYLSAVPYGTDATDQKALFTFYKKHGFVRTEGHPFEMVHTPK